VPDRLAPPVTHGWGRTPVDATVDGTSWRTSVWRGTDGRTLLAVPARVRGGKADGDRVRATVRSAVPGANEHFSYGIPGFRLDDEPLIWYGAWDDHISLYPIDAEIVAEHAEALEGLQTSTGTVRFPFERPPSDALLKKLLRSLVKRIRSKVQR
jgi:uncharacterized protein YdhG (YjbR/CyaY superfamily)